MKQHFLLAAGLLVPHSLPAQSPRAELLRWQREAARVTIVRDDHGIPHLHGPTDAAAVFGLMYAQAEDDFNRVETNYLTSMGRLAEAEGQSAVYSDLRMKLFIDPDSMKAMYARSPVWLRKVMNGWADGLNYYLATHPAVHPRVLTRFEPWMALTFSEGSIGGDIERISLAQLEAFYGRETHGEAPPEPEPSGDGEPRGSNGIAIAPSNTLAHRALLLINPHTSFFFRAEVQVTSDEGLNAYGAVTWGQFFVYQGFNERAGWMHTSSGVDNIDEYREVVTRRGDRFTYRYGGTERPVSARRVVVPYRTPNGMSRKEFTVFRTHHGPIVRQAGGKWISVRLMQEPLKALTQSYARTKTHSYREFRAVMDLHTNSSNNTIFADADGNIAYFHANFIPRRDPRFDWSKPVDGSDTATEWHAPFTVEQSPHLLNPAGGWLYNSNDAPWTAAGADSPRKAGFPAYVETGGESARGHHAVMVLEHTTDFTPASLNAAAYDSYLPAFARLIPPLLRGYDSLPSGDPLKDRLRDQIATLRTWDYRWSVTSVPTSLAVFWGEELGRRASPGARAAGVPLDTYAATADIGGLRLQALIAASDKLSADFGTWRTAWGDINRFQRLTGDIVQPFNDAGPSIPVGFTSAVWGSLASFGANQYPGTKKRYGTNGNSFVAIVEFGKDSVRARAVTAGGESGDPASPHFNDQAERYSTGDLRAVYYYPSQLAGHTERTYHPGH